MARLRMYSKPMCTPLSTSYKSSLSGGFDSSASDPDPKTMIKIRQDLTLQQSPNYPGIFTRFLQGHQVLNLTERHQHTK
jgi:hypothetical protein